MTHPQPYIRTDVGRAISFYARCWLYLFLGGLVYAVAICLVTVSPWLLAFVAVAVLAFWLTRRRLR